MKRYTSTLTRRAREVVSEQSKRQRPSLARRVSVAALTALCLTFVSSAFAQSGSFDEKVAPFLKQYCVGCHGAKEKPEGDLRLDTLRGSILPNGGETEVWVNILEQLQSGEMPPKKEPQPDATQKDRVIYWIRTELRKIGKGDLTEQPYPDQGNYLDHERLFGAPGTAAPATPARLWRISPFQYTAMIDSLKPRRNSYVSAHQNRWGRCG